MSSSTLRRARQTLMRSRLDLTCSHLWLPLLTLSWVIEKGRAGACCEVQPVNALSLGGPSYGYMGVPDSFAPALPINIIMTHHVTHMSAYGNVSQRCVLLCLYLPCVLKCSLNVCHRIQLHVHASTCVETVPTCAFTRSRAPRERHYLFTFPTAQSRQKNDDILTLSLDPLELQP